MEYDNNVSSVAMGSIIGARNTGQTAGPLVAILSRLDAATDGINHTGQMLRDHADKVHGDRPPADGNEKAAHPVRMGIMGEIEDALDRLANAQVFVADQASRNCSLV